MMTRLIPKIFYEKMADGLFLFVTCLGFSILHQDETLAVVQRDSAKAYLVQDAAFAAKDRPEIAIETDDIDALYAEISGKTPQMLHPSGKTVELKPWGARICRPRPDRRVRDLPSVVTTHMPLAK